VNGYCACIVCACVDRSSVSSIRWRARYLGVPSRARLLDYFHHGRNYFSTPFSRLKGRGNIVMFRLESGAKLLTMEVWMLLCNMLDARPTVCID